MLCCMAVGWGVLVGDLEVLKFLGRLVLVQLGSSVGSMGMMEIMGHLVLIQHDQQGGCGVRTRAGLK